MEHPVNIWEERLYCILERTFDKGEKPYLKENSSKIRFRYQGINIKSMILYPQCVIKYLGVTSHSNGDQATHTATLKYKQVNLERNCIIFSYLNITLISIIYVISTQN